MSYADVFGLTIAAALATALAAFICFLIVVDETFRTIIGIPILFAAICALIALPIWWLT